jgi:aspartyl/asparaginyl-tRNA synthetase
MNEEANIIDSKKYHEVVNKLRSFFRDEKGFIEVPAQSRLSIMAACEDPGTLQDFHYGDTKWPLPQTGQMWLEYELLNNPDVNGYYSLSTSYRYEPDPVEGRHDLIFPMFEFETDGDMEDLIDLECDLLDYLGFPKQDDGSYPRGKYEDMADEYDTDILEIEHENKIGEDYGSAFVLTDFPERTSPFWNMKRREDNNRISKKVDVLLCGMETIGSAERSCDPEMQRDRFHNISDGKYAEILFDEFGRDRVEEELENFLSYDFFTRCGGGIGITRMIRVFDELDMFEGV